MDPITLMYIAFGFKGMEEIAVKLGFTENTALQPMNLISQVGKSDIDRALPILKEYEKYSLNAYKVPGENFYTIGYGSTNLLNPMTGVALRSVKSTDKLSVQQAIDQVYYYYIPFIPAFNLYLSKGSYKIHPFLASMLLQNLYMTGLKGFNYNFFKNCVIRCNGVTDLNFIAQVYLTETINTYKSMGAYSYAGKGWSRRFSACADFIRGTLKPRSWYDNNIKKAF